MERPPSNISLDIDAEFQQKMSGTLEKMVHKILIKKPEDPVRIEICFAFLTPFE